MSKLTIAEQLTGKRYKDLSRAERAAYHKEYSRLRTLGELPAGGRTRRTAEEVKINKAEYMRRRREAGVHNDSWIARRSNAKASAHNNKMKQRYGSVLVDTSLTTRALADWWEDQDKICYLCGEFGEDFDHVIPLSKGGEHSLSNLRVCCVSCNSIKNDNLLEDLDPVLARAEADAYKQIEKAHNKLKQVAAMQETLTQLKRSA